MKNTLRRRFERFCFRNRNKGISNLMLYICVGSGIVSLTSMMNGGAILYDILCFDKALILQGQVWRLFSWLLTEQLSSLPLLSVLFLYFFYRLGRAVEQSIGTFKFNLFYLSGVILMDIFAMVFCPTDITWYSGVPIIPEIFTILYSGMAYLLHLGMVLAFATMYPDAQFLVMFVIPVKAWVIALVDLILIGVDVFNMCYPLMLFPHCLFPLIGLLNYFLFFGPNVSNLLPLSWRAKLHHKRKKKSVTQDAPPRVIPFTNSGKADSGAKKDKPPYNHCCVVCGRTDLSDPQLEFRYCSRCSGYRCYCEDHISNHTHITE